MDKTSRIATGVGFLQRNESSVAYSSPKRQLLVQPRDWLDWAHVGQSLRDTSPTEPNSKKKHQKICYEEKTLSETIPSNKAGRPSHHQIDHFSSSQRTMCSTPPLRGRRTFGGAESMRGANGAARTVGVMAVAGSGAGSLLSRRVVTWCFGCFPFGPKTNGQLGMRSNGNETQ